ncbi:restriction endonuclease subunit S [Vibrio parahaemolyticus]|nr:restriction endonuclease subunit S [Vibrio parahaemolyticus]ELA9725105.1 restriction endonuclease subunit S [Vibrio parahaemolyticus]
MKPNGWSKQKISDILERVVTPVKPVEGTYYREIGIRSHGKGIFHKEKVTSSEIGNKRVFEVIENAFVVNIVFAWEQAIAKTSCKELGFIASHRFPQFLPKDGRCDIDYLVYFFKTPKGKYLLELASPGGAGRNKTLGQKEFDRLELVLPPVPEQRKIAQILSTWDKAISTTEKLIDTSKQQKKALMQQLLTGKKRLVDPETGKAFEGEWEEVKLGDVCIVNPKKASEPENGLVSFIPMDAVSEDAKLLRKELKQYSEVFKGFTAFIDGDVLVAKITPCFENGKGAQVFGLENGVGFGSTEFHVLRAKKNISSEFIYFLTNTSGFRIRGELNMQGSAGQKRVTTDYLKLYKMTIPKELSEQQKIASVLTAADKEIELLETKLAHFKQEKKALMQQLLTGKRRVRVAETEVA